MTRSLPLPKRNDVSIAMCKTVFAPKLCIDCDACVDICPMDCITFTADGEEQDLRKRLNAPAFNITQDILIGRVSKRPHHGQDEDVCLHCGLCAGVAPQVRGICRNPFIQMTPRRLRQSIVRNR